MMGVLRLLREATTTLVCVTFVLGAYSGAFGQAAQGTTANSLLAQSASAFSGDQVVQKVQLSGTVTLNAGDLQDSGTITLTAAADGSLQTTLLLSSAGQRTETKTGIGSRADCQWSGADQTTHDVDPGNCWKSVVWFLPSISLQPSLLPSYLAAVDLGTVGSSANVYRHVQSQLAFSGLSSSLTSQTAQQSITDLGFDPVTLLPSALAYTIHSDSGSAVIAVEVHYSNYQRFSGLMIPCHIERYLNGSLELAIDVTQATSVN